jgi:hypothetical protein
MLIVEKLFVTSYSDFLKENLVCFFYRGAGRILNTTGLGV